MNCWYLLNSRLMVHIDFLTRLLADLVFHICAACTIFHNVKLLWKTSVIVGSGVKSPPFLFYLHPFLLSTLLIDNFQPHPFENLFHKVRRIVIYFWHLQSCIEHRFCPSFTNHRWVSYITISTVLFLIVVHIFRVIWYSLSPRFKMCYAISCGWKTSTLFILAIFTDPPF